jgi:hypothetical protein
MGSIANSLINTVASYCNEGYSWSPNSGAISNVAGTVIVSTLNRTVVNLIANLTDSVMGFSGQCGGQPVANI